MLSDFIFIAVITIIAVSYAILTRYEIKMRAENNPCYLPLKEVMTDYDLYSRAKKGCRIISLRSKIEAFLISLPFLILFFYIHLLGILFHLQDK